MSNRKEYFEKYYQENKEKLLAQHKNWLENNPEYMECWYKNNSEHWKEYKKQWHKDNPEYNRKYQINWRKTETGKANIQRGHSKQRAGERELINTLTFNEWLDILKKYHWKCAYCGKEFDLFRRPERDHIIPLNKGGNNTKENILPSCRNCNAKKQNKIIDKE